MSNIRKTHWKTYHNPDYIGAYAFQPNERKIVTIKSALREKVSNPQGKKEDCLVCHFLEDEKPLICNVTNSKAITKASGSPYIEDWIGARLELYVTEVQAFGDTVEAVRVRMAPEKPVLNTKSKGWEKAIQSVAHGDWTIEKIKERYKLSESDEEIMKKQVLEAVGNGKS